jgi:protein-S-isoprenylcysteine O-methyltransferase Ste14
MPDHVVRLMWMLIMTIWAGAAGESGAPVQSGNDRRSNIAVGVVWIGLLVFFVLRFGNGPQFIPRIMFVRITGVVITFAGLAFALWSRFYLGRNWSAYISLTLHHKLIRTGPYSIVRHPIYAGFILALIGSLLNFGHLRSFIAAALIGVAFIYKSGLEETFMQEHFGTQYEQYQHDVKRLVPNLW